MVSEARRQDEVASVRPDPAVSHSPRGTVPATPTCVTSGLLTIGSGVEPPGSGPEPRSSIAPVTHSGVAGVRGGVKGAGGGVAGAGRAAQQRRRLPASPWSVAWPPCCVRGLHRPVHGTEHGMCVRMAARSTLPLPTARVSIVWRIPALRRARHGKLHGVSDEIPVRRGDLQLDGPGSVGERVRRIGIQGGIAIREMPEDGAVR